MMTCTSLANTTVTAKNGGARAGRRLGLVLMGLSAVVLAENNASVEYDCLIEPDKVVALSMAVEGVLATVEVDRGDRVEAGQVLARLDSRVEEAAVAGVRVKAAQDSELRLHRAELALARRKAQRIEDLYKDKNASGQERDEARAQAEVAAAQLGQAQEARRLAELELARAEAALARRTLRSPIDAVVIERHRDAGEYVEKEPVVTVARIDPLRVEALLPAEAFGQVIVGQELEVRPVLGDSAYQARVGRIDPVLDTASGTFAVRLSLPNPDYQITSGLECRLTFQGAVQVP